MEGESDFYAGKARRDASYSGESRSASLVLGVGIAPGFLHLAEEWCVQAEEISLDYAWSVISSLMQSEP